MGHEALFRDRRDAGRQLAARLGDHDRPIVVGLPRGGMIVAGEVARALGAPLDVVVARRLSAPGLPGFGIGALAEGGHRIVDTLAVRMLEVTPAEFSEIEAAEAAELKRRLGVFRGGRPAVAAAGRTVIVVDDGLASGLTARAALKFLADARPARLVLAVPVAGTASAAAALGWADEFVSVAVVPELGCVADWYHDFGKCPDAEVLQELARPAAPPPTPRPSNPPAVACLPECAAAKRAISMSIETPGGLLEGLLEFPGAPRGVVLFAHGSGSGRSSPRGRVAAEAFLAAGFATLRLDLLTDPEREAESSSRHLRFNVGLLAERLQRAAEALSSLPDTRSLPLAGFGASTGAAAMFVVAARHPGLLRAIVSRGGRPDLAGPLLPRVSAPALLVVGGNDAPTEDINRDALGCLSSARKELAVVPGAGHLFEEPGALEEAARLAAAWFERNL